MMRRTRLSAKTPKPFAAAATFATSCSSRGVGASHGLILPLPCTLFMPPALDRLLASPSALRLLRALVNGPAVCGCHAKAAHRHYATRRSHPVGAQWKRWKAAGADIRKRDQIRRDLEAAVTFPASGHAQRSETVIQGSTMGRGHVAWAATLSHRERHEGQRGIMAVWELRQQALYDLPCTSTAHAEYLWGTFVKHPKLVEQVIDHAAELLKETRQTYPGLYSLVMTYWLPRDANKALDYHHQMLSKLELKTLPLRSIAHYGRSTFNPAAYEALIDIYRASELTGLYDEVVPPLIDRGRITMARRWHNLCTFRQDLPSESVASHPVVRILTAESSMLSDPTYPSKEAAQQGHKYNGELMRRMLGRDTAPVRFEDSFCAKMFATNTFPPASVIKGLAMVGVNEIGPQAVHAMASRTEPLEELPTVFEELKANGVALQGCVFSLAVEKFAKERSWGLVRSMLESDQHPDVFGDAEVQRKLLDFYLDQDDHIQARRTLAILTLFHKYSSHESWNLLLQTHIRRTGPQHVTEVLQDMRIRGVPVTLESIAAIKRLLRRRQIGRRPAAPNNAKFDDLRFVTRVFMTILEFGMGPISPLTWREIIRRFGMTGRFKELRRLLLWLLCWYAPRSSMQFANLPVSPFRARAIDKLREAYPERDRYFNFPGTTTQDENKKHPVRQLIPPSLQQALIIWGFRAGLLPNARLEQSLFNSVLQKKHYRRRLLQQQILQRARWSIGLRTVVLLRDLGVHVHYHTVIKALQMQFIVLFGHGTSRKLENRAMEDANSVPYAQYVREVNKYWGSQLFKEPQLFHKKMIHDHMWHPRMRRRIDRRASINLVDILGPGWQQRNRDSNEGRHESAVDDLAVKELERKFAAQTLALNPGPEWMHEASLATTKTTHSGGRIRTKFVP
jgi:hypothetical protein